MCILSHGGGFSDTGRPATGLRRLKEIMPLLDEFNSIYYSKYYGKYYGKYYSKDYSIYYSPVLWRLIATTTAINRGGWWGFSLKLRRAYLHKNHVSITRKYIDISIYSALLLSELVLCKKQTKKTW